MNDEARANILGRAPARSDMVRRVTYANIGKALAFIRADINRSPVELIPLPPDIDIKANFNALPNTARQFLSVGQTAEDRVKHYLLSYVDPSEADRMAEGFHQRYKEVVSQGAEPGEVFKQLIYFSGGASGDPDRDSAALVIVAYFFSICIVFERPEKQP